MTDRKPTVRRRADRIFIGAASLWIALTPPPVACLRFCGSTTRSPVVAILVCPICSRQKACMVRFYIPRAAVLLGLTVTNQRPWPTDMQCSDTSLEPWYALHLRKYLHSELRIKQCGKTDAIKNMYHKLYKQAALCQKPHLKAFWHPTMWSN